MKNEIEETIFKNASEEVYCKINYDNSTGILNDTWTGNFGAQENFKKVLSELAEIVSVHNTTKLLTDLRQMIGSFDSSRDWIISEIFPKMMKGGLRYQAIVLPKNIFSQLSTKDYMMKLSVLEIHQFSDNAEARKWLADKM